MNAAIIDHRADERRWNRGLAGNADRPLDPVLCLPGGDLIAGIEGGKHISFSDTVSDFFPEDDACFRIDHPVDLQTSGPQNDARKADLERIDSGDGSRRTASNFDLDVAPRISL